MSQDIKLTLATLFSAPSIPRYLNVINITSSNVTLTWSPPSAPKGVISHYLVNYSTWEDVDATELEVKGLKTVVTGLSGNSKYTFKVQACNTDGRCGDYAQVKDETKIGGKNLQTSLFVIINPRLPEPFFVTRLLKGVVTTPSLDFCCKASDSYDFGTGG